MHADPCGLAHSLSPVDLPDPDAPLAHPLRWTSCVIALAVVILGLLNAHAIRGWAYQLPPSAASARVVILAETWHDGLDDFGLNRPSVAMRSWWKSARDRRFDSQDISGASNPRMVRANASSAAG